LTSAKESVASADGIASRVGTVVLWAVAGVLMMLPFLWAPLSLQLPLGRDQGIFTWVAEVILRGGLPYADAWEVKGPGAHFLYALARGVFGESGWAVRAFDLVMMAVALVAFIRFGRMVGSPLAGLVGFGVTFVLFGGDFWMTAQPDNWAGILLLWMVLVLLQPRPAGWALLVAGVLLGVATLIKPPYALFGLFALARAWLGPRSRQPFALLAPVVVGALLPIGACALMYAAAGKLGSIWEVLVVFDLQAHFGGEPFDLLTVVERSMAVITMKFAVLIPIAAIGAIGMWANARPVVIAMAAGAILSFVVAAAQNKFFEYHFAAFDVFLAALVGLGIARAFQLVRHREPAMSEASRLLTAVAAAVVLVAAVAPAKRVGLMWGHAIGLVAEERWQAMFYRPEDRFLYRDIAETADFVRLQALPEAPIYLWGFDALVYVLADRYPPTRYGYNYPLIVGSPDYQQSVRAELMASLARTPPALILVQTNDVSALTPQTSLARLDSFPALKALIAERYEPVFRNDAFIVYRAMARSSS
jgi:hypothetical protein